MQKEHAKGFPLLVCAFWVHINGGAWWRGVVFRLASFGIFLPSGQTVMDSRGHFSVNFPYSLLP